MIAYTYTLTEYDPDEPWIVRSTSRDSIELDDGADFHAWAHERWPSPRYRVKPDPSGPMPFSLRILRVALDARGRTRTCDPRLRRPSLYPAELRGREVPRVSVAIAPDDGDPRAVSSKLIMLSDRQCPPFDR
jgi:hypothetical protein